MLNCGVDWNPTVGSCVYYDSYYDVQPWLCTVHTNCSA